MYKRWQGNSGLVSRVEDRREPPPSPPPAPPPRPGPPPPPPSPRPPFFGLPFFGRLEDALGELELEDLLLMAVLYLLYRESGDSEWLLILGCYFVV